MSGRNRFPFTANQWQELEHQALIFKYIVSGLPIPPDLLFSVKRSLDSSLSSKLILHQPQNVGWDYFQMGFGKKIDPEPGRCRRTDGKKWRCSKEAYPDSKYCERHMHRGRNRSRKPVEITTTTTNNSPSKSPITKNGNPSSHSLSSLSSMASETHNHVSYNAHLHQPFLYSLSSSSRPPAIDFSPQENNTHLLLDSNPNKDYRENRYGCGMREEVDGSGTVRSCSGFSMDDHPWQPSLAHLKQGNCSVLESGYPFLKLTDTDFNCEMPLKMERDGKSQKIMHHFLDECPKDKDSWLDSGDDKSSKYGPSSTTHLSMSMPNSSHDFFMAHN
ncbi:Growth-regulating factor like, partial [Actinidia chinensis var. chinensis]